MKSSLALLATAVVVVAITVGSTSTSSPAFEARHGVDARSTVAILPQKQSESKESINVNAIPTRYIYVQFPGEDSQIITLKDLDSAISKRTFHNTDQVPAESTKDN